jgi:hypothetical protein
MDVLREQIQKLRPEEQEHVFALLLNDNVPFHKTEDAAVVPLSKASEGCLKAIQSYIRDVQTAQQQPRSHGSGGNAESPVGRNAAAHTVHFDRNGVGEDSDGESPDRKMMFTPAQTMVRKRIKITTKRTARLRKSSSRRDYGERLGATDDGSGDAGHMLAPEGEDEDVEIALESDIPDPIDIDLDGADLDEGDADDNKSVDITFEDDDVSAQAPEEDETKDVDDIRGELAILESRNAKVFQHGNTTVGERFSHYVDVLSGYGYRFGDFQSLGYPRREERA